MVKKKSSAAVTGVASSSTVPKAIADVTTKAAPEASPAATKSLGLISAEEGNIILPGSASRPNPPAGFTVMFVAFLYRGLSLPAHEFLRRLLLSYGIQLWQLTPNSILHLAIFITLFEAFLGIDHHWGLWKKIFFVKCYNTSNGSFITGGVGFVVRKDVNYFNFPMREQIKDGEVEAVLSQRSVDSWPQHVLADIR
jgi:hypothetical protein